MKRFLLPLLPCLLSAQAPPEPARIQTFQTEAKVLPRGGTATLRWSTTGATQVRLEPIGLILPAKGEVTHVVTGRTIYWLHVTNSAGGQSVPLVVDVLPEALAAPVAPLPAPPAAAPEWSRLSGQPTLLSSQPPARPVAMPARHRGSRQVWIQFATTVSTRGAVKLQGRLQRVAALGSTRTVRTRRSGRPYQLVRSGPFPSVQAARLRLAELAPAMRALNLKPLIVLGPPSSVNLGTTYLADAHQPK
jgi:hypothetical protein